MNEITLIEFKEIFKYIVENNKNLAAQGKKTTAIGCTSAPGIGKTSIVRQIAAEEGMTCVVLRLAQIEEVGDICGFPIKEFKIELKKEDETWETKWVPSDLLSNYMQLPCTDYNFTGETRMGYAPPAWLPREENPNGTIVFLDDFNRCNTMIQGAVMELINEGTYVSWSLPKNTTIALSRNPDDGNYSVQSEDSALLSRYIDFNIKFDINAFAEWAENYGLDGRAINFAIYYENELFDKNYKNHLDTINPRSYTTFCNAISGIKDWSNPTSLGLILNISKGCFHDEDNIVGGLFTNFIANKLDKLVSPEDMLLQGWDTVSKKIESCVYDGDQYHPEIAAVLHTRLLNYAMKYFETKGSKASVVQDRLIEFVENNDNPKEKTLLSEDLLFNIIKTLIAKYPAKTNKLLLNPQVRKKVL